MRIIRMMLSAIFVTASFFVALPPAPALADQANPDSVPVLVQANVFRNLLETGDQLYIFYANIPYASLPDALVTEAFIWRLISTDNTTVIGQTVGTSFNDKGYGYNVYSMYFPAADAPAWNQPYTARLSGNPSIFDIPPTFDFVLSTADFSTLTVTTSVQDELALRILTIANDLFVRWSLDSTTTLINAQETGSVLSSRGETFFRGAIFGLQAMAPAVFQIAVSAITAVDREWDTTYVDNITAQYSGTFVGTAQTAGATFFGKGYDLVSLIGLVIILILIVVAHVNVMQTSTWAGLIDATLIAVLFARIGIPAILLPFMGLVGGMCWVYVSGKVWGVWR